MLQTKRFSEHQKALCWPSAAWVAVFADKPEAVADGGPLGSSAKRWSIRPVRWKGTRLARYPEVRPELTVLQLTIPPGVKLAMHIPVSTPDADPRQLLVISEGGPLNNSRRAMEFEMK